MNAGTVKRLLNLIPERVARSQSGALYQLQGASCAYPERLAHLTRFLGWLSPVNGLSREDQAVLGLVASNGRPMQAVADEEDGEEVELDSESAGLPSSLQPVL